MLNLAVLDDEADFCSLIKNYAERLCSELDISVSIESFQESQELFHRDSAIDILFLDIQVGEENGIEIGRRIRAENDEMVIVFMTNYLQYAVDGYSVRAYRYLLKPITYTQFKSEISNLFLEEARKGKSHFLITTQSGQFTVQKKDILFIETVYGKKVIIHTTLRDIEQYNSMSYWEKNLGNGFFRIHNSFLVNLDNVDNITQDLLFLRSGSSVPISKYRKKDFMNAYTRYMGGKL